MPEECTVGHGDSRPVPLIQAVHLRARGHRGLNATLGDRQYARRGAVADGLFHTPAFAQCHGQSAAERSPRHLVVSRKISGGTRSQQGTYSKMALAPLFGAWRAKSLNSTLRMPHPTHLPSTLNSYLPGTLNTQCRRGWGIRKNRGLVERPRSPYHRTVRPRFSLLGTLLDAALVEGPTLAELRPVARVI